jgi:ribosomal protein S18 acetylase RimI-like enzyme
VTVPPPVIRFWRALDDLLGSVQPTRWGAVVTDPGSPAIWDTNYGRIDADTAGLTVAEVERDLLPALARVGTNVHHVVAFDPDGARDVIASLSSRGHRLSWDLVMTCDTLAEPARAPIAVAAIEPDDAAWGDVRTSLVDSFGVDEPAALDQLMRLEREVLGPGGKRWFGVRERGRWVSLAASLVLDGVGYLDNVATTPAFRGRGYASAVTAFAAREALAESAETVFLLADPDEPPTVKIYERIGFRAVARLASTRGTVPA